MKEFFEDFREGVRKVCTATRLRFLWSIRWELLLAVGGGAAIVKVNAWIRATDPGASPVDLGILSVMWLPFVVLGLGLVAAMLVLNFGLPTLDRYTDGDVDAKGSPVPIAQRRTFQRDWAALTPLARVVVLFSSLGVVFVAFIAVAAALLG